MKEDYSLVSVIIPTYKRSDKLPRAVRSVLNQTYSNVEVLVVSDNEPDDEFTQQAAEIVASFNDSRVKLVKQEHHKNGAAARNAGIKASTGSLIAFLDDDDFWDKEKLEIQVPVLLSLDESWGGVSCKNKIFKKGFISHLQLGYKSGYLYRNILYRKLEVSTDTVLLRKKCLLEAGLYDENLKRHQEVQLLVFFTHKYKLYLIDKYLCNVDIDDNRNRPSPEKIIEIKKAFLASVKPIMEQMSWYDRYSIKLVNKFEIGGSYALHGNYWKAFLYCLCVLLSPSATFVSFSKILRRTKTRQISKEYANKTIEDFLRINNLNLK